MKDDNRSDNYVVVMLDVLGFKEKMRSDAAAAIFRTFVAEVVGAKEVFDGTTECNAFQALVKEPNEWVYLWSDTLVFLKGPVNEKDGRALSSAGAFATNCITSGLPQEFLMRGAIAVGRVFWDRSVHAVAGPAIVECAENYEAVDWVGCHLCLSAERFFTRMNEADQSRTNIWLSRGELPWKGEIGLTIPSSSMFVNWLDAAVMEIVAAPDASSDATLKARLTKCRGDTNCVKAEARRYFRDLLTRYAVSHPVVKAKVENTLKLLFVPAPSGNDRVAVAEASACG